MLIFPPLDSACLPSQHLVPSSRRGNQRDDHRCGGVIHGCWGVRRGLVGLLDPFRHPDSNDRDVCQTLRSNHCFEHVSHAGSLNHPSSACYLVRRGSQGVAIPQAVHPERARGPLRCDWGRDEESCPPLCVIQLPSAHLHCGSINGAKVPPNSSLPRPCQAFWNWYLGAKNSNSNSN